MWDCMRCLPPTGVCSRRSSPLRLCEAARSRVTPKNIYLSIFGALPWDQTAFFFGTTFPQPYNVHIPTPGGLQIYNPSSKDLNYSFNGELQLAKLELSEFPVDNFNCQNSDSESRMPLSSLLTSKSKMAPSIINSCQNRWISFFVFALLSYLYLIKSVLDTLWSHV